MRTAGDRRAEGLREIAYEIARLEERRRPREFRERLAPEMSVEDGIRGRAEAMFRELAVGDADLVVGRLLEVSEGCDVCMRRAERIARRIRSLRRRGMGAGNRRLQGCGDAVAEQGRRLRRRDPRNRLDTEARL